MNHNELYATAIARGKLLFASMVIQMNLLFATSKTHIRISHTMKVLALTAVIHLTIASLVYWIMFAPTCAPNKSTLADLKGPDGFSSLSSWVDTAISKKAEYREKRGMATVPRVLLIINELEGITKNGGIGTAYAALIDVLLQNSTNYDISVMFSSTLSNEEYLSAVKLLAMIGVELHPLLKHLEIGGCGWHCNHAYSIMKWLMDEEVKGNTYDIVHFHDYLGFGYYSELAKKEGLAFQNTKFVVVTHGPMSWASFANAAWMYKTSDLQIYYLERRTVELADFVISPSTYLLDWMKEDGWVLPESSFVQPNLLNQRKKSAISAVSGTNLGSGNIRINELVFFGRLEKRKGLALFCDGIELAFKNLKTWNVSVTFMGKVDKVDNVPSDRWIRERTKKWPIEVSIFGKMGRDEALAYISQSGRLVVIPSMVENSPYTVLECLDSQIPFLASHLPGIAELIQDADHSSVLFQPKPKFMAAALNDILANGAVLAKARIDKYQNADTWNYFHQIVHAPVVESETETLPLVTVIMTHNNRVHLLRQALDSLMAQDYPNVEVIVVDDASSNETMLPILDEIELQMKSLGWTMLRNVAENMYLGAARNWASTVAKGEYYLFMDDDNYAKPEEISTFVKAAKAIKADLMTCFVDYFHGLSPPKNASAYNVPNYMFIGNSIEIGLSSNCFGDANFFVRAEFFKELGGFSEDKGLAFEDWEFLMKSSLAKGTMEVIPIALFWKRGSYGEKTMIEYALEGSGLYQSLRRIVRPFVDYVQPSALRYAIAAAQHHTISATVRQPNFDIPPIVSRCDIAFEKGITLISHGLPFGSVKTGSSVTIALNWKATASTNQPYYVFVHLRDQKNAIVAQADDTPRLSDGYEMPTTKWIPNEIVMDVHRLAIPQESSSGDYHVWVGIFTVDPKTNKISRLNIQDTQGHDDHSNKDEVDVGVISVIGPTFRKFLPAHFSSVQGAGNLRYGYTHAGKFQEFEEFDKSTNMWSSPVCEWISIGKYAMHPCGKKNDSTDYNAVLQYESEFTEDEVSVIGNFILNSDECGDGVKVTITLEGFPLWSQTMIKGQKSEFFLPDLSLPKGTILEFIVDPLETDACDGVWLEASILGEDERFHQE